MYEEDAAAQQAAGERASYLRAYRVINYSCIGLIVMVFSVMLSRSLGWVGLVLPSLLIAIMYLAVTFVLDLVIFFLELRNGSSWVRRR